MAAPSVTYTFSNSTTADATQVNTNFTDLINGMSDGTKDFSINALTCAGTVTLNGAVTLGNASGDDITVTGSLASSIPIKTNTTYNIGSATLGLLSVYIGGTSTYTTRILGAATATYTITLPVDVPSAANAVMSFTAAGVASFEPKSKRAVVSKTTTYTATAADDIILVDGSGGAWTLSLPAAASNTGKTYWIKRTDNTPANAVTLDPNSTETLEGSTTKALYTQNETVEIVSDGNNWRVLEHKTTTPWVSYTPTFAGFGTVSGVSMWWRRVGDTCEIRGKWTNGTVSASTASMTFPTGVAIDSAKLTSTANSQGIGLYVATVSGAAQGAITANGGLLGYDGSDTATAYFYYQTSSSAFVKNSGNTLSASSSPVTVEYLSIPVSGWWE